MLVRRRSLVGFALVIAFVLVTVYTVSSSLRIRNFISYSTRPLWDKPLGPHTTLPHYYAEGVAFDAHLCALHGWAPRTAPVEVWDAVLFSSELDLLEIRMHELAPVVSKFFVVEADRTFTGRPKPLTFSEHRDRFAAFDAQGKLVHSVFHGRTLAPGESPFANEGAQRGHMNDLLRSHLRAGAEPPLVIFSDVDEIPSAHTIRLLQACEAPSPIHLQMREYLYSFEWPAGEGSWRAQVHRFGQDGSGYNHGQVADWKLADSGWHCSFCFRHLHEFADKMSGYSHADRVTDPSLLKPERIQQVICEGKDIFGMLPEAYRWKDLLSLMDKDATPSAVHVPRHLIENSERFRFLLPGGCIREE